MIVPYDPQTSSAFYYDYYSQQSGNGLAVFKGATIQRGKGIGSFFSKMLRGAMPLLKSGAKTVGKQLLASGSNIANDVMNGENLKTSTAKNFSVGGKRLLNSLVKTLTEPEKPKQTRKRKRQTKNAKLLQKTNKKPRVDNRTNIFR